MKIIKHVLAIILCFGTFNAFSQAEIKTGKGQSNTFSVLEKSPYKVKIKINTEKIKTLQVNTIRGAFTQLSAENYSNSTQYGYPALPVQVKLIEVPYGAEVQIKIISYNVKEIKLSEAGIAQRIIPAQPSLFKNQDPADVPFHYNEAAYNTDDFNQDPLVSYQDAGIMRGVKLGKICIAPIRYNPIQNIIEIFTDMVFEVQFKHPDIALTEQTKAKYYSPAFEPAFGKIINYSAPAAKDVISKYPIKYVIISLTSFQATLQPFVQWKTKKGFKVVEQYYSSAPTTSTVKTYLQSLYTAGTTADPAPTFVLFVGDVAQIPAYTGTTGSHPTDVYYCTFDGTSDYIPDMYYGRFSATSVAQLQPQIDKTLQYEQYTMPKKTYLDTVVMVAGADATYGPTHANGQINYGTVNYFNAAHGMYSYTHLYPQSASDDAIIRTEIGKGVGYANYTAHCGSSGWGDPEFNTSHISAMINADKYGLMVGNCCLSNKFNDTECFGEALLRVANKGAVGYIGASNNSLWNEDFYWSVGNRSSINANPTYSASNLGAYDCMFHDHGEPKTNWFITNDQMIYAGNLAVEASTSSYNKYYWEIYHLMGDPSVMNYFSIPDPLTVNYSNPQNVGITSLVVNTEEDAYVAISLNGVLLDAELAPVGGVVTLNFPAINTPDTADVVVTKQNKQPYIGSLYIVQPSTPRNAEMVAILTPEAAYACTGISVNPVVIIRNMGTLTMTSVRITYQVSGGSANVFNWTGSLASMQTDTVTLPVAFTIAAGTYSFTATTSLPNGLSDQNPSNDSKTKEFSASSLPVSSNFSADATESCDAPLTVQFTNTSTNTSTYLWNFGDGNTSTDMNPTYVYASLGTYNVNLTAYAGICGSDSELKSAYIQVGAQAPLTTDASRCGPGSVTLAASGTGVLNWFASSTGGSIINTGVSYNTPSLSATTTYYVSTTVDGGTAYAAKTSSSTAGGYFNNAYVHGLYFDALQPFVLITAKVYANSTASRKFVLINGSGVHIDSVTVSIPSGESRITLNMNIPAGQNMSLVGPTSPNLWRDGSTTSSALPYPYTLPGVLSITKSTAGSPNELIYYYYLYDWEIELPDCSSARTPVTAYIYSTAPVASFNVAYAGTTVNFTNTSQNGATYQWNFGDGNTSTDVNPSHTYSSVGTYNVMLISTNNCSSDTTWQQVNIVTTGISEEFSANIEIYPNPVNDQLFVKTGNIVVDKIVITDILGKVTGEIVVSEKLISIDVSAYQAGVYFVRIYAQGATATYRITKTR